MSGGSQTTTQKSEPWKEAQPALKLGLSEAMGAYNNGAGSFVPTTNIAGQSAATTDALGMIEADARNGLSPLSQAGLGWAQKQFASNGMNPYVDEVMRNAQDEAATTIGGRMSGMGRYGSGVHQGSVAKAVADVGATTRMNAFNSQQALNAGLLGQLPMLEQQRLNPATLLAGVGTLRDARAQDVLADANAIQQEQSNLPWHRLGLMQSATVPYAGMGGTVVSTQQQKANPFSTILGGGMAGLGLLGKLGGASSGASGLGSLFALLGGSDERIKENVEKVGKLDNGLSVYSYNYKGDSKPFIGLLAQEVEKTNPAAVSKDDAGIRYVDYGLAVKKKAA